MRGIIVWFVLVAVGFGLATNGFPQTPRGEKAPSTLEDLEREDSLEKMDEAFEELETLANQTHRKKRLHCLRAFGNRTFCECLADKTPVAMSFLTYIGVVTATKEELGYPELGEDNKMRVDAILAAREVCVARVFGR